jgi:hypothetical protein
VRLCELALELKLEVIAKDHYVDMNSSRRTVIDSDSQMTAVLSVIVAFVYIDTGSCLPICSSKSRGLADENNKIVTEWK